MIVIIIHGSRATPIVSLSLLDSDSLSLCLDMWYVLPTRNDVADRGLPGPRRIPRFLYPIADFYFQLPFFSSSLFLSLFFFSKNRSSSRFVSVMRRLLARALKQKRGRTICRTERGERARASVYVRKRNERAAGMKEKSIRKCD